MFGLDLSRWGKFADSLTQVGGPSQFILYGFLFVINSNQMCVPNHVAVALDASFVHQYIPTPI